MQSISIKSIFGEIPLAILFFLQIRIRRGIVSGLVIAALLCALCWFLCLFYSFIDRKAQEIENAYDTLPVTIVISNIRGTQTDDLGIYEYLINDFVSDRYAYGGQERPTPYYLYVKDICLKTTLYYDILGDVMPETNRDIPLPEQRFVGITTPDAASDLAAIDGVVITYFREWNAGMFRTDEQLCIVSRDFLDSLESDEDGTYNILLAVQSTPQNKEKIELTLKVAGYYSGDEAAIYCPWNIVAVIQKQLDGQVTADRMSASIQDNRKLDEFRALLKQHFAEVDPSGRQTENPYSLTYRYYRYAVTIHDEALRQTINELSRNLQTLNYLLPLIVGLEIAVGFTSCFFYIQTRKQELSVARSLGTRGREVLLILFIEVATWSLLGAIIALAVYLPSATGSIPHAAMASIVISAVLGTLISGITIISRSGLRGIKEEV